MQISARAHEHTNTHGNGWKTAVFWVHLPDERVTTQRRKEGRKEGRRTREKAREKEQLPREREKALDSIRSETNNSVLCWIDTRISFLLPFYARSGQQLQTVNAFSFLQKLSNWFACAHLAPLFDSSKWRFWSLHNNRYSKYDTLVSWSRRQGVET